MDQVDKVIEIDQSPIGRTPRSNPATYTGLWTPSVAPRLVPEARLRGYKPGRFFNVKGGRCEACEEPASSRSRCTSCPTCTWHARCKGQRYSRETLEIHYKGGTSPRSWR